MISDKLNDHLADIDEQAEDIFFRLVKQMAKHEDITERLKSENQMAWVGRMNNIRNLVESIILKEIIYA